MMSTRTLVAEIDHAQVGVPASARCSQASLRLSGTMKGRVTLICCRSPKPCRCQQVRKRADVFCCGTAVLFTVIVGHIAV